MKEIKSRKSSLPKLGRIRRKSISLSPESLVETGLMAPQKSIPFVISPTVEGMNLEVWIQDNRELVEQLFSQHRALLFRGFVVDVPQFYQFVGAASDGNLLEYRDRSTPRHEVSNKVYTSTEYPADQEIALHNEGSYWITFPLRIFFYCATPPETGGSTPIADCRRVFNRIAPEIRQRFASKQILYVRNYNSGFGLPWQQVFQTEDKAEVESYCRANAIEFEWKSGDRLRTYQRRPAIVEHPITGEKSWFNHAAFFNISSLAEELRNSLLAELEEDELPYNTYYGDGTPIDDNDLAQIRAAYQAEKLSFPWQQGDIMMLDNLLIAHGRDSYRGPRKILVSMTDAYKRKDV